MSISGILSSSLLNFNTQGIQDRMQQFRKDFQQLGQDLQTGNLSGAQADFAAMQKDGPQSSSAQSSNPIAQTIQQLSTDLQSGNLTGAQQDYTNLQQDFQNQASQMQRPHHHHRNHSGGGQDNGISQVLSQLGQDLQSGDVASAQKAYSTLQQDLQQYAIANGALDGTALPAVNASA
jgi:outer membrane protein assembly factor BamD (BamD/ComL family)